jgi:hypothetical protein
MKPFVCAVAFACVGMSAYCQPQAFWNHGDVLTNTASFHEVHSVTKLPPEVVSAGSSVPGWTIEADGGLHPTRAQSWRLVWAVTDDKYYVAHTAFVYPPGFIHSDPGYNGTNYWIVIAAPLGTNSAPLRVSRWGYHFVKDYRTFVREMEAHGPDGEGF